MKSLIVDIRKTVRSPAPSVPFEKISRNILPRGYRLSLVLCGDTLARSLNVKYRKKTYKANVLSFPLSKNEGEIFLNVACAAREARRFGIATDDRVAHLFIHACLHLRGYSHGATMDLSERRFVRQFGYTWPEKSTPASTSARTTSR